MSPERRRSIGAAVAAVFLALAALAVAITDGGGDEPKPAPAPVAQQQAPQGDLQAGDGDDTNDLKDETPLDVPREKRLQGQRLNDKRERQVDPSPDLKTGGASRYTCKKIAQGPMSSRNGSRVLSVKLHYTVSPNLPGTRDIYGIDSYFKRTGVGSAHRIIDFEGNCIEPVPPGAKAWTQGNFNPTSYSYEIIATGSESRAAWEASPLIKRGILASFVRDDIKRFGLRTRFVDPVGCADQIGYTDHNHLECGNDHHDVAPNFPFSTFARQLKSGVVVNRFDVLVKPERTAVSRTCYHRAKRNKSKRGTTAWNDQNGHVSNWKAQVKRNYVRLHSPWKLRNRGVRRQLQVNVYVNRKGSCSP